LDSDMLTYEEAARLLHYDPLTGLLRWKVSRGSKRAGSLAGNIRKTPASRTWYRTTSVNCRNYHNHRLCWLLYYGEWPPGDVDHADHNGLNNKIENLRDATSQQNKQNMRLYTNNRSGHHGVRWVKNANRWEAQIGIGNGRHKYLGKFVNIEDAIAARKAAEVIYGFHCNHGKDTS